MDVCRFVSMCAGLAAGLAMVGSAAAVETIGPWMVRGASSATLVSGEPYGPTEDPLAKTNEIISVDTAFSGESIIEDGWANLGFSFGPVTIDINFAQPVRNNDGDDLVFFDCLFSNNSYFVSTEYDGFGNQLFIDNTKWLDTGERRDYWWKGGLLSNITVLGQGFDLSNLGVAPGDSVSTVRFVTGNNEGDPLGIGAIVPAPGAGAALGLGMLMTRRARRSVQARG